MSNANEIMWIENGAGFNRVEVFHGSPYKFIDRPKTLTTSSEIPELAKFNGTKWFRSRVRSIGKSGFRS